MQTTTKPDYDRVLKLLNGAIKRLEMYPPGHPATFQAMEKPFSALQEVFKTTDHLTISRVEDKVVVNGKNIEGADLLKRLLEEFENENLNSLSITKNLTREELNTFLSYFVKPLGQQRQKESLPEFLKRNNIRSIKVDLLRYELVTEDEVVVKAEIAEGANIKAQISKILKENPDLLREIFLSKGKSKGGSKGESGKGFENGPGSDQFRLEIEKHVKELSDEELLSLIAASLEQNIKRLKLKDSGSTLNEVAELVNKLLQDRERSRLLPQVKKILTKRGIVKKEHLDFLFDEKWLKSQEVLDELIRMIEKLGTREVSFERFMFLLHRIISSEDGEIRLYAINKLLSNLDSKNPEARSLTVSALEGALSHFIEKKMEPELLHIRDRIYEKIKSPNLSSDILKDCSRVMKSTFFEMIRQRRFEEVQKILKEYNARLSTEETYPQEIKKIAQNFLSEVSDDSTLTSLISQLREGIPFQELKQVEEILRSLDKDKVAPKLLEIFTVDDRTTRISALRVLGQLGKSSISAVNNLLSNPGIFIRKKGSAYLLDEQWYKVRNAIYVLGNISEAQSVQSLSKLTKEPDIRVRLEVIKALERIGGTESVSVLLTFLNDEDDEVRKRAITSLTNLGDKSCLKPLKEHLRHNRDDIMITLSAIAKIGGKEAIDFLVDLLWEKDRQIRPLPSKQKDQIKIYALNILGKIGSSELVVELEKFVKQKGRSLKNLLVKDRVLESANRALKMIEKRDKDHLYLVDKKKNLKEKDLSLSAK